MAIMDSKDLRKVLLALIGGIVAIVGALFAVQAGYNNHCSDHSVCGQSNQVGVQPTSSTPIPSAAPSTISVTVGGQP
ncbi:hypothetical protein ABT095_27335 [Kitasatospora sp. NPDC002227]|uniref:hypothetical protein n=1 Tax=Kitasatospora sp. NPDC002227 TaxID=3154773 RepID=UPI0033287A47